MDSGEHLGEIDTFQGGRREIERQPPESEKCCFEKYGLGGKSGEILLECTVFPTLS